MAPGNQAESFKTTNQPNTDGTPHLSRFHNELNQTLYDQDEKDVDRLSQLGKDITPAQAEELFEKRLFPGDGRDQLLFRKMQNHTINDYEMAELTGKFEFRDDLYGQELAAKEYLASKGLYKITANEQTNLFNLRHPDGVTTAQPVQPETTQETEHDAMPEAPSETANVQQASVEVNPQTSRAEWRQFFQLQTQDNLNNTYAQTDTTISDARLMASASAPALANPAAAIQWYALNSGTLKTNILTERKADAFDGGSTTLPADGEQQ